MGGLKGKLRRLLHAGRAKESAETLYVEKESDVERALGASVTYYELTPTQLSHLIDPKNPDGLRQLGGVEGISQKLSVELSQGLSEDGRLRSRQNFGRNVTVAKRPPSIWRLVLDAFLDKILLLLTAAALVSLTIGIIQDVRDGSATHWIEGAAILLAVVIVVLVNSLNDYQREKQFRMLSARSEERQVMVQSRGRPALISIFDLVVGDVLLLEPGVKTRLVAGHA